MGSLRQNKFLPHDILIIGFAKSKVFVKEITVITKNCQLVDLLRPKLTRVLGLIFTNELGRLWRAFDIH